MNGLEHKILTGLSKDKKPVDAHALAKAVGADYNSLMSALEDLGKQGLVELEKQTNKAVTLTQEGIRYKNEFGMLPERKILELSAKGLEVDTVKGNSDYRMGLGKAIENGWIGVSPEGKSGIFLPKGKNGKPKTNEEMFFEVLTAEDKIILKQEDLEAAEKLKKRRIVEFHEEKIVHVKITTKGGAALKTGKAEDAAGAQISQLTPQMLKSGEWKKADFRGYDLQTIVSPSSHLHAKKQPYFEFIREIKESLVALGFEELTGSLTELEFWNMDALYMPQDHPAREIHDVFQLALPPGEVQDKKMLERVKKAHETGVAGSTGWGYKFSLESTMRVIARSHDTGISARGLSADAKPPQKKFFIARVFRPDEIDWKHFTEFNQLGGYVVDENMTFRELLGYLRTFAVDICGAEAVKFAPSYFPFTEPSCEMLAKIRGKWTEIGGAGMFRPEMLEPLGCKAPTGAWGLGLERLAMMKLGVTDIRELYSQKLEYLRERK